MMISVCHLRASTRLLFSQFPEIPFELIERTVEALGHRRLHGIEARVLFICGFEWPSAKADRGPAILFRECDGIQNFKRPIVCEGCTYRVAIFVGERVGEYDAIGRHNFTIVEFAPHLLTGGGAHPVVEDAAWPEIERAREPGGPRRSPPFRKML